MAHRFRVVVDMPSASSTANFPRKSLLEGSDTFGYHFDLFFLMFRKANLPMCFDERSHLFTTLTEALKRECLRMVRCCRCSFSKRPKFILLICAEVQFMTKANALRTVVVYITITMFLKSRSPILFPTCISNVLIIPLRSGWSLRRLRLRSHINSFMHVTAFEVKNLDVSMY